MPSPPDPGVPLADYIDRSDSCGVRFHCRACQDSFDVPLAEVIAKLKAKGLGDERTGVRAVAWLATKPCDRCGALKWQTMPAYGPRPRR